MPDDSSPPASFDSAVGLCSICANARELTSAKGSTFWRCALAASDPGYLAYPPLPVLTCKGFREDTQSKG